MGCGCDYLDARTTTGGGSEDLSGTPYEVVVSRLTGIGSSLDHSAAAAANAGQDAAPLILAEIDRIRSEVGEGDTTRIRVLVDGYYVSNAHRYSSYESWVGLNDSCGFRRMADSNVGSNTRDAYGLFFPRVLSTYPADPTTYQVEIGRMRLDGNRRDNPTNRLTGTNKYFTADLGGSVFPVVTCVDMIGCEGVHVHDLWMHDTAAYGIRWAGSRNCNAWNVRRTKDAADVRQNDDILHFNGGCFDIRAWSIGGKSLDDGAGICASDGDRLGETVDPNHYPQVVHGPIVRVTIDGLNLEEGSRRGVRFLDIDDEITDVAIRDLTGEVSDDCVLFDTFGLTGGFGNYRGIVLDGLRVKMTNAGPLCDVRRATVYGLVLHNVVPPEGTVAGSNGLVRVSDANSTVHNLTVDGCYINDPSGTIGGPFMRLSAGMWDTVTVRNLQWERGTSGLAAMAAITADGGTGRILSVDSPDIQRIRNVVAITGGTYGPEAVLTLSRLLTHRIMHRTALGTEPSVLVTGGTGELRHVNSCWGGGNTLYSRTGGPTVTQKYDGTEV